MKPTPYLDATIPSFYYEERPGTIIQAWRRGQRTATLGLAGVGHAGAVVGTVSMIEIPPIDELREARRRLSEEQGNDVARYAIMLRQVSPSIPGSYVTRPLRVETPGLPTRPADE